MLGFILLNCNLVMFAQSKHLLHHRYVLLHNSALSLIGAYFEMENQWLPFHLSDVTIRDVHRVDTSFPGSASSCKSIC